MEKGEALLGIAMTAWKEAKKGVNADFKGHRVVKSDKVILIMPRLSEWPLNSRHKSGGLSVVAYPRPEHVEAFKEARRSFCAGEGIDRNSEGERCTAQRN